VNHETLADLLSRFGRMRVVVLGDVMLDRFVYGTIERISPEAPIPVISIERTADMPGGAANVARNCASLGAQVVLVGVVGEDTAADHLRAQLALTPTIDVRFTSDPSRPTTVKTRYVAEQQQMLRADAESRAALADTIATRVSAEFTRALDGADIVLLSDYA
jgi:D-beta-D-heptose 7-phosphate kinase/D-beta-D-heptose 1-phosphate adenosyltransferase